MLFWLGWLLTAFDAALEWADESGADPDAG